MTRKDPLYEEFLRFTSMLYAILLSVVGVGLIVVNGLIQKRLMHLKKLDEQNENIR
jgi:hypothetical protein